MESDKPKDIVAEIRAYLIGTQGSETERNIMQRALTEIDSLRSNGDSPLALRNSELAWENRRLREENRWLRVFGSMRMPPPMEQSK
jgi:hypothetical protein